MPKGKEYVFTKHLNAEARTRSARRLIERLLEPDPEILPEHQRECLNIALWKLTLAESVDKHRTRYCSEAAFANPAAELRHDHVFQRSYMVDKLTKCAPSEIASIIERAVGCTITREEHSALNWHKHLDGWARYEAAGIKVRDASSN